MGATWNAVTVAQSEATIGVVRQGYLRPRGTHTRCPWTGHASLGAWHDPDPEPRGCTRATKDPSAFGRGVQVEG